MDFEEWFRKHEREVFKRNQGCFDKAYIFGANNGFKAGQQSKQAEIDAITKWVEENKKSIPLSEWHGYTTEEYVDADDLLELLK